MDLPETKGNEKMKQTKKLSFVLVFVILAILSAAVVPAFADDAKTEAINEAKASFSDLYEAINPSVVYILVGKASEQSQMNYDMDDFDFGDIFGPEFERFFRDWNNERDEEPEQETEPELSYG